MSMILRSLWSALGVLLATHCYGEDLTVFAAASLKEAATKIASKYQSRHPNVHVILNFGGSQQLAAQIRNGAKADLLMSAGYDPLKGLSGNGKPRAFATNSLVIVSNPKSPGIRSLMDLAKSERLVVADGRVPVGHYTELMLDRAAKGLGSAWKVQLLGRVMSREQDVRAVLTKVEIGEADAGIVYLTDAKFAGGKVRLTNIPARWQVQARYPLISFSVLGKSFGDFVLSADAQQILGSYGFGSPYLPSQSVTFKFPHWSAKVGPNMIASSGKDVLDGSHETRVYDFSPLLNNGKWKSVQFVSASNERVRASVRDILRSDTLLELMADGNLEAVFTNQGHLIKVKWLRTVFVE